MTTATAPLSATIEVFRPGTFGPMQGGALTFSADDLRAAADAYDPQGAPAPVVIGHPATDAPAFGWVAGLRFSSRRGNADMIREPFFQIFYQGVDITDDPAMSPTSIVYTDKRHGESDEVQVTVNNSTGQWLDEWHPDEGDRFKLIYGYTDEKVPAGEFVVDEDEPEGDSGGDRMTFKGLAAPKTQALRTSKHEAYEDQSLAEIVEKIAGRHSLTVEGEIEDVQFERVTQNGERDLQFLTRLADDYGHYFTVKGNQLVFTSRDGLRAREPVRTIDRITWLGQKLKRYRFRNADHVAAVRAEVRYHHPQRKQLVGAEASSVEDMGLVTASGDVIKAEVRVENDEQAKRVAKSRLDSRNARKVTGSLSLVGDPLLVAGSVIALTSFGRYDGRWLIVSSRHSIRRSGYDTEVEIERITDKQQADGKAGESRRKKKGKSAQAAAPASGVVDMGRVNADGSVTR